MSEAGHPGSSGIPSELVAVRVGGSGGRAWGAAIVIVALLGFAAWKPWQAPAPSTQAPSAIPAGHRPAAQPPATPLVARSNASNAPGPDAPAGTAPRPLGERLLPGLEVGGLDFTSTGLADTHWAWGVSAAYVPRSAIVSAVQSRSTSVSPVVDWLPVPTGARPAPSSTSSARATGSDVATLNGPASITVVVAVTWPSMVHPVAVELVDRGAAPSVSGGSGRGRPAGPAALVNPLPAIVRMTPAGLDGVIALARVPWELRSGTFFLPAAELPTSPAGWLTSGWRAGAYEFRVTMPGGGVARLPFAIGN